MKKYWLIIILILLFAALLRFYNFENRIFIFGDSARDVLVARASLENGRIPQIASFSSAGPFVFAPHYYWLIMAVYKFNMNFFPAFYYFLIFQSVLFVAVLMWIGQIVLNRKFGLILGLIAAMSPRAVIRAMGMSQHAVVGIFSAFALLFLVLFIKKKSNKFIFLSAVSISLAISMHYQAIALFLLFLPIIFVKKNIKEKVKSLMIFILGLVLPLISFLWWDKTQNFANINNFLDYLLIGQHRIYVANRWLWHLFDFWPSTFADLFGGNKIIGGVILYASLAFLFFSFVTKKLSKYLKYIFAFFICYFIYLRFYKGEKFEGYLIYLHPFILTVSAFFIYQLSKLKKIGFFLIVPIFYLNFCYLSPLVQGFPFSQEKEYEKILQKLNKKTSPQTKFMFFDFADSFNQTETWDASDSLVFYLYTRGRIDDQKGVALAFCKTYCPPVGKKVVLVENHFIFDPIKQIYILKSPKDYHLVKRSAEEVRNEILFWWKDRPLKSSFNLGKYILERIPIINKLVK